MKRIILATLLAASLLGVAWGTYRVTVPPEPELSRFVPTGALLYLQAKDFSSLLSDWDKSSQKEKWLKSKNYDVFSQSRLFLRLKDALNEVSTAAGVPANDALLHQVAGKQSAVALYDIGRLEFLYVTRLSSSDAMRSVLWQGRGKFETRNAGGVEFFYRADPDSGREVAFAATSEYLLLATRQDLMASALQLIAGGGNAHSLEEEAWWQRPIGMAGPAGDLRMVLNLEKIVPTPYFRSYWIQRNVTDTKQYSTAVSDLARSGSEYREERILFKKTATPADPSTASATTAVSDLLRLVPPETGIYEAKANPDAKEALALLIAKILAPHLGPAAAQKLAPEVSLGNGETGSGSDLETRIDQAPSQNPVSTDNQTALANLVSKHKLLAQLQIQTTERDSAGVFVRIRSAVALASDADWDEKEVHAALAEFLRPGLTSGQLGIEWKPASGYSVLDGLWSLAIAVRGKYLVISDNPPFLNAVLANFNQKPPSAAFVFAAGFSHQHERESYVALTKLLNNGAQESSAGTAPDFFSENIASLSFVLKDVSSEKIVIRDAPDRQMQTITYEWAQ